jgi:hypothetical protein
MGGPEEWSSRRSNLADRIRLTGPAANKIANRSFDYAQDFGNRTPLRAKHSQRLAQIGNWLFRPHVAGKLG